MLTADMAEGLEAPVQLLYLATLLGFVAVGAYLVVRQVLVFVKARHSSAIRYQQCHLMLLICTGAHQTRA